MNQKRMGRVSQEIKKVLSYTVSFVLQDPKISKMTSITDVTISPDLAYADIYFSVMGNKWDQKQTLEGLEAAKGFLKKQLAQQIDLRQIPELRFHFDDSIERGMKMDALIQKVIEEDERNRALRGEGREEGGEENAGNI